MKYHITFGSFSKRAKWIVYPTVLLSTLNFFAAFVGSLYLGGDALHGYIKAGRYFVCAHASDCSEVSAKLWHYSYWHNMSAIFGILLVFAEISVFVNTKDIAIDRNAP